MIKHIKLILILVFTLTALGILSVAGINLHVLNRTEDSITSSIKSLKSAEAAILPGAGVYGKYSVSAIAFDRIVKAVDLYRAGKVKKILITGDHGTKHYDEVNNMRRWCMKYGVPAKDIFMDHAGFSTYESIYRAREIFRVNSAVIVTQRYHLPRALYLAQRRNITVQGYPADRRRYLNIRQYTLREYLARIKDFFFINVFKPKPTFLGKKIPITGDGRKTGG